jgi:hypothetical protein
MDNNILTQLVALSNTLGRPELDYVILGEGNTSARADANSFYVKTSGTELRTITAAGFAHVAFDRVLTLLDRAGLTDADVKAGLSAAKLDPAAPGHPSVETLLHALCLQLPGISFVGHTHATAINMLTCSVGFEQAYAGRLFPDEIVLCGPAPVLVPYTDPGVPLAREVWTRVQRYMDEDNLDPKPRADRARPEHSARAGRHRDGRQSSAHPARHVRRGRAAVLVLPRRRAHPHPAGRDLPPATVGAGSDKLNGARIWQSKHHTLN